MHINGMTILNKIYLITGVFNSGSQQTVKIIKVLKVLKTLPKPMEQTIVKICKKYFVLMTKNNIIHWNMNFFITTLVYCVRSFLNLAGN